ncbi:WG repeat-containing protein [Pontibacillus yanchengensis]|uniref:DUF3298 domain-containing protein n=1 Tax=Pontibacillus yanchengensis Y32 TaxID=1385514 RepID=A0A0A2TJ31_9BACI|nr:WG repeat-containing protein [Pontibacillus yanchengensis]KGP74423.1 hypothetical protein N782_12280 [Pontibacillus yanchengensis Y32]
MHPKLFPAPINSKEGERWGYIDARGDFRIQPQFGRANDFQKNGLAIVEDENGNYGVIDTKGQFIVKPEYQYIAPYQDGRAVVSDQNGYGVIDEKGNVLTNKYYSFIGSYQDDVAVFSQQKEEGTLYGYLNKKGEEVIPAQYLLAEDFKERKALVKIHENQYALLNKEGKLLYTYPYPYVGQRGDGLLVFQRETDGKYGYINEKGKVILEPQYDGAQAFRDGRAVINRIDDYLYYYGLINKSGKKILDTEYNDIEQLGENRIAVGKAVKADQPYLGSLYAIATTNGEFLSDFRYENVLPYKKGLASAHDQEQTFFLNRKGKIAQNMPILPGQGTLSIEGPLIKAMIDYQLYYVNDAGEIVWRPRKTIRLNNQYRVLQMKYKPNPDYLVYYPIVRGMEDVVAQREVNDKLKDYSQVKPIPSDQQLEYSYYGNFEIEFFQKELLVLELNGSQYYFGAAHPMPTKIYTNINLVDGEFFELKDLFKPGSSYVEVLSQIVADQIAEDENNFYTFPDAYQGIKPDQPCYVNKESLFVYFPPYDIAPYAAGFVTFEIPFSEIIDIIDQDGAFWRSFH